MKKVFFTVFLALCCTMGFAQLSFNVKAGLNLSSYIGDNSDHSKFKPGHVSEWEWNISLPIWFPCSLRCSFRKKVRNIQKDMTEAS